MSFDQPEILERSVLPYEDSPQIIEDEKMLGINQNETPTSPEDIEKILEKARSENEKSCLTSMRYRLKGFKPNEETYLKERVENLFEKGHNVPQHGNEKSGLEAWWLMHLSSRNKDTEFTKQHAT